MPFTSVCSAMDELNESWTIHITINKNIIAQQNI
jgi:hypothetical protein